MKPFDWTGQRWGSLVAVQYVSRRRKTGARWVFRCDCGHEKILHVRRVRTGEHTTCGYAGRAENREAPHPPSIQWPFPLVLARDGEPVSPVWRDMKLKTDNTTPIRK